MGIETGDQRDKSGSLTPHPCLPFPLGCEPAITMIPSLLAEGVLAIIVDFMVMIWAAAFVQRKSGGVVLILLYHYDCVRTLDILRKISIDYVDNCYSGNA